ncbi:uncharacterized protein B0H64DRAFT_385910 [Chaetomium fimeti]|uniref:Secreted protein n=1 Tax=Chaetomium fimeti TaxID=1854472 RepID=A0AAE0HLG0_9PEZI|nr:hypothetical protein B0H64DRAFT_385910 [Chaetomium fimeti]
MLGVGLLLLGLGLGLLGHVASRCLVSVSSIGEGVGCITGRCCVLELQVGGSVIYRVFTPTLYTRATWLLP